MPRSLTRRAALGAVIAAPAVIIRAARATPAPVATPAQIEGPFHPGDAVPERDADLTRIKGRPAAKGRIIQVKGRVLDHHGRPVSAARVELWQANAAGRYAHPRDSDASGPLDPGFQGWGEVVTGAAGVFSFRSIIPGTYAAAPGWERPPHLHFKVAAPGGARLTTQTYFGGHPLNAKDGILQALTAAEQRAVTIDFAQGLDGALEGRFEVRLGAP